MRPLPLLATALAALAVLAAAVLLLHEGGASPPSPARRLPASEAREAAASHAPAPPLLAPSDAPSDATLPQRLVGAEPAFGLPAFEEGVTVRGSLVDERGEPVPSEVVELWIERDDWDDRGRRERTRFSRGHADAHGRFVLPARTGVSHVLMAGGLRFPRVALEHVTAGDELLLVLPPPGTLTGVVADAESGEPLPGAHVLVLGPGTQLLAEAGDGGRFTVAPLADQPLLVSAWTPGHGVAIAENVLAGEEDLLLELPEAVPVKGVVVDRDGGQPIAGATLRLSLSVPAALAAAADASVESRLLEERVVVTGDDGTFLFEDVPDRGFSLHVTADGYVPDTVNRYRERRVQADDELEVALRRPPVLAGTVVRAEGGLPVRAAVRAEGPAGVIASGESDAAGRFDLLLETWDGEGPLEVVAVDAEGRSARHRQQRRDEEAVLLELVEPAVLAVSVLAHGEPVDGAALAVLSQGSPATLGTSRAAGPVPLAHPLAGPHVQTVTVQARHRGASSLPLQLEVAALPDEPLVLELHAGVFVEGRVFDEASRPLPRGEVRFAHAERAVSGRVGADGRFAVGPVEAGSQGMLRVDAEGYRTASLDVVAGTGEVDVFLQPHVLWEGRVVDALSGGAPRGWSGRLQTQVTREGRLVWRDTSQRLQPMAGEPGAFRCRLPGPAMYRLHVRAPGRIPVTSVEIAFDGQRAPPPSELLLFPSAVLRVSVLDASGRPVPGYALSLVDDEQAFGVARPTGAMRRAGRALRTGDDGSAEVDLGEGGRFRLAAGPNWLEPSLVEVDPGAAVARTFRIEATGDLRLELRDRSGAPLADPTVSLRAAGQQAEHWVRRRVRARGPTEAVRFDALPPGAWRVSVRPRGKGAVERTVVVAPSRLNHAQVTWDPAEAETRQRRGRGERGAR